MTHLPNPADWPGLRCADCGRPTRFTRGGRPLCKGGCPTAALPTPAAPIPVAQALEQAPEWEEKLED